MVAAMRRGKFMGRDEGKESDVKKEREGERLDFCDKHVVRMAASLYNGDGVR